jgi:segregation and condensation protein B
MDTTDRLKVLELLLWMTDRPLKYADFQDILGADCPAEPALAEDIGALARSLDEREAPFQVTEIAGGFQLATRPAYSQWVRRLFKDKTTLRLSPSAMETLSIIAYKQPITRGEIEEIRGVEVSGVMETLLDRRLVKMVGRREALGRPWLYGTTTEFMKQFGLKSLGELPNLEELVPPEEAASPVPSAATVGI